ncbi:class I SAM-dependent methyltransferase [Desulfobulbus alkaliphilus]|nr:class I SAM-dependent methyltransferase [Desulfobulbus alkaliphilus]
MSRQRVKTAQWLKSQVCGVVLDVGCGNGWTREIMPETVQYVGIDYPTTVALGYEGRPDLFADASCLPVADKSVDTVLLLDVLEHLDDPEKAVAEAARVLRLGGVCLVQVPFLYPLHDEPHDYQRWTNHGLKKLFLQHGFHPEISSESNYPCATAAALFSIALAKGLLDTFQKKSLMVLIAAPLIAVLMPLVNVVGLLLGWMLPASSCMPGSYLVVAKKEILESNAEKVF